MDSDLEHEISDGLKSGMNAASKKMAQNSFETLGSWVNTLAFSNQWYVEWRIKNLINIQENFKQVSNKLNLTKKQRDTISMKFGYAWIESASNEDDPTLQELWAKLLGQACLDNSGGRSSFIYIDILNKLTPIDAKLVKSLRGVDHFHIHTEAHKNDSILKLIDTDEFEEIDIENIYESVSRLQLIGLLRNGYGGRDCFHVTGSLDALMQCIEPLGRAIVVTTNENR